MKIKVTEREEYLFKESLNFHIHRYLMAKTMFRVDGYEQAARHIEISKKITEFISLDKKITARKYMEVHRYLAKHLTDRLQDEIEFDMYSRPDGIEYKRLSDKFFDWIVDHLNEIEKIIRN